MIAPTDTIQFQPAAVAAWSGLQPEPSPLAETGSGRQAPQDTVQLSRKGRETADSDRPPSALDGANSQTELSPADQRRVAVLKQRDREVRAHEQAHIAAGGGIVQGGAVYQAEQGPDGRTYAVGGEVKIDSSPERDPADTIRKMAQVRRAALAPMEPSATDRSVAARAHQLESQARAELAQQSQERFASGPPYPRAPSPQESSLAPEPFAPDIRPGSVREPISIRV